MADSLKKMKTLNTVLAVLLGLSLLFLLGVLLYGYLQPDGGSAVVPDNYIAPATAGVRPVLCAVMPVQAKTMVDWDQVNRTAMAIYKNHPEDSTPFYADNMFPGDRETKAYLVEVSHRGTVTVHFHADIRPGYEKLAEVLLCKVVIREDNAVLYDGLMRDMPQSVSYPVTSVYDKTTPLTYDITVSLDTSVGNAYMNKELVADFRWWAEEKGSSDSMPPFPPFPPFTFPTETTTGGTPNTDESAKTESGTTPGDTTVPTGTGIPHESTTDTGGADTTASGGSDTPGETAGVSDTSGTSGTAIPGTGELIDPPPTGDTARLGVWLLVALAALFAIILLLGWKWREGGRRP